MLLSKCESALEINRYQISRKSKLKRMESKYVGIVGIKRFIDQRDGFDFMKICRKYLWKDPNVVKNVIPREEVQIMALSIFCPIDLKIYTESKKSQLKASTMLSFMSTVFIIL
jgi:hypothetical protein